MLRVSRSLYAFRLIEPDEQFDLFACRENRFHLAERQLALGGAVDRTLCGSVLPARPRWGELQSDHLRDRRLCPACKVLLAQRRKGLPSPHGDW